MGRLRSPGAPPSRRPLILADTSAWVEYDRGTGSPIHRRMHELTVPRSVLAVTAPVVAELAMGARTDENEQLIRTATSRFTDLRFRGPADLDAGAAVYRRCRKVGVTADGLVDCVIVAIALREKASLLTADIGQARVAQVMGVPLDPASVRPRG